MDWLNDFSTQGVALLSALFIFLIGLVVLLVIILFIIDLTQTRDAIRHNFPVIGRFRYLFSHLGEFFRQYFFSMDREEMPFNRAEREWVYLSAAGVDNTIAFGSTKPLNTPGTVLFINTPFPTLDKDAYSTPPVLIGPGCREPYEAGSLIHISGMSYGAISIPAVRALSLGAKLSGCWLNTGEGGLSPYHLEGGCELVFQIGTAKYGVRNPDGGLSEEKLREIAAIPQVKMFEIKLSQGAKPGKGGILPGAKVTEEIAAIRGIEAGRDSISPNRHPEISNFSELLNFINHIRDISGKPVGFKIAVGTHAWLEEMCEMIHQCGTACAPDFITIDGGDGGTGAAPMPLMDSVGLPIKAALPRVVDILQRHGLRKRIKVIASGKLINPSETAWALCAGADFVTSARGFMLAMGCIQALKCNKNTCPTGITTHNKRLQQGLDPKQKAVRIKNFVDKIHYGSGLIAHSCGAPHPRALRRSHCQIVQANTQPVPLDELYPYLQTLPAYRSTAEQEAAPEAS
ncbi:MAG: FMN-binding glutamate synthase family protein [Candidatus Thiodiazotropha sp. (ex Epidulcina cf. delphinae)]|nr:FMN-binding glutamate synthase family protein [Candidatus Thiodiazotropha sp. (ex Epidulcina cf. delphinae)]